MRAGHKRTHSGNEKTFARILLDNQETPDPQKYLLKKIECLGRDLLGGFRETYGPVLHQLESYEHFLQVTLPQIFEEFSVIEVVGPAALPTQERRLHRILLTRLRTPKPTQTTADGRVEPLYPAHARTANLVYASQVHIDVTHQICVRKGCSLASSNEVLCEREGISWVLAREELTSDLCQMRFTEVPFFELPVMLRSSLCYTNDPTHPASLLEDPLDPGGYFIYKHEKVLIAQQKPTINFPCVYGAPKNGLRCEIRSLHEDRMRSSSTAKLNLLPSTSDPSRVTLTLELPFLKDVQIPLLCAYRLLGCQSVEDVCALIVDPESDDPALCRTVLETLQRSDQEELSEVRNCADATVWAARASSRDKTVGAARSQNIPRLVVNEFFPHAGAKYDTRTNTAKALFLSHATRKILRVYLKLESPDDRDSLTQKRFETAGVTLGLRLRQDMRIFHKDFLVSIRKHVFSHRYYYATDCLQGKKITTSIYSAMVTGNWTVQRGNNDSGHNMGVSQMLNRINLHAVISHLRTVNTQLNREGKQSGPRQTNQDSWGRLCPCETPEGRSCGFICNLSQTTIIRVPACSNAALLKMVLLIVREFLQQDTSIPFSEKEGHNAAVNQSANLSFEQITWARRRGDTRCVWVNGSACASVPKNRVDDLAHTLREARCTGKIERTCTVHVDRDRQIWVHNDIGAVLRPLLKTERIPRLIEIWMGYKNGVEYSEFWQQLLQEGLVEFLDTSEEREHGVAPNLNYGIVACSRRFGRLSQLAQLIEPEVELGGGSPELQKVWARRINAYDYCELDETAIMGICGSQIPYLGHNQMPRNMYQIGMAKQSLGLPALNYLSRVDTNMYSLSYPQKPIVSTNGDESWGRCVAPSSQVAIVAIAAWQGSNLDDSLAFNKASLERGLFRSTSYKTYRVEEKQNGVEIENVCLPTAPRRPDAYAHLQHDGLPEEGQLIKPGQILVSRVMFITNEVQDDINSTVVGAPIEHEQPIIYKGDDPCVVDKIFCLTTPAGLRAYKIRIRVTYTPEIGDKFSSRHGQKGVIGMIYPQEDLPFNPFSGMVPDCIINPHCKPRRMTIGHLLETHAGKVCAIKGTIGDGTPFKPSDYDELSQELSALGMNRHGNEMLYDGRTGRWIQSHIFMGPVTYQRLKHMVAEKRHERRRGRVNPLTRQAVEGRSRDGGLRMGEMERDCMLASGTCSFLQDRMIDQADALDTAVCTRCGLLAELIDVGLLTDVKSMKRSEPHLSEYICRNCRSSKDIRPIRIPYVKKLMTTELMAMGICPRFQTKPKLE